MDGPPVFQPLGRSPTIDVVVPARNRAHFLPACLNSVIAQTLQPKTVFVIDDGSIDGTSEVLADFQTRWPQLRAIRTEGVGVSAARNAALALSTADLIAFIDSDDVWDPGVLAALASRFTDDQPRLGLVNCGLRQIDAEGLPIPNAPSVIPTLRGDIFQAILERFYGIAPSTLMVRRDVIVSVGGFDETLIQAEDRDLCLRLARIWDADCVPTILVGLRQHNGNTYGQAMLQNPEFVLFQRLQVWNRWLPEIKNMDAVLGRFRAEALSTSRFLMRKKRDFGLYDRLRDSEFELARQLFPTRWNYLLALMPIGGSALVPRLKSALVIHVIAPNKWLLRLVQKFGRLRGWQPSPAERRVRNRVR
jgi:glycosyltransferase involved in cell wall biosynthesis